MHNLPVWRLFEIAALEHALDNGQALASEKSVGNRYIVLRERRAKHGRENCQHSIAVLTV